MLLVEPYHTVPVFIIQIFTPASTRELIIRASSFCKFSSKWIPFAEDVSVGRYIFGRVMSMNHFTMAGGIKESSLMI